MTEENRTVPMPRTAENAALGIGFERALPKFKKGARLLVWYGGRFRECEVIRRCPGPVYWAKFPGAAGRSNNVLVSCNNYGGCVDAG